MFSVGLRGDLKWLWVRTHITDHVNMVLCFMLFGNEDVKGLSVGCV
jgi:hypothetical protein